MLVEVVLTINLAFCLSAAIISLVRFRHLALPLKILVAYLVASVISEALGLYCTLKGINSLWIYHFYVPLMIVLWTLLLNYFYNDPRLKTPIYVYGAIFTITNIIVSISGDGIYKFDFHTLAFFALIFSIAIAIQLHKLLKVDRGEISALPRFWVMSGLFLSSTISTIYFAFINYLVPLFNISAAPVMGFWIFHNLINLMAYVCYILGFTRRPELATDKPVYDDF